jgi:hypothetical protein
MKMNNGYAICFNEWSLDKEIKNELGLLLIISSLCAEKGYCFASNEYLGNLFNLPKETISRKIKILQEKNYITIEYDKRGCEIVGRRIRLTKMLIHDYQNCYSTINKNVKDNNIIFNNTNNIDIYISEIQKFKPILSSTDYALIKEFIIDRYTIEQVKEAITICENNNAYSIKYLIQVLVNPRKEKYKVALKNGINPKWLNEDIQAERLSSEELEELENEFKEFRK